MWRNAAPHDDPALIEMCLELNREDPGEKPVTAEHMVRTLEALRRDAVRGKALAFELQGRVVGYALLISFWSNELGGEICVVDELYVRPDHRGKGHATGLIRELIEGRSLWPNQIVALDLEVTPKNDRARALYSSLGFAPTRNAHMRLRLK